MKLMNMVENIERHMCGLRSAPASQVASHTHTSRRHMRGCRQDGSLLNGATCQVSRTDARNPRAFEIRLERGRMHGHWKSHQNPSGHMYISYGRFVRPGHFPVARARGWRTWPRGPLDRKKGVGSTRPPALALRPTPPTKDAASSRFRMMPSPPFWATYRRHLLPGSAPWAWRPQCTRSTVTSSA